MAYTYILPSRYDAESPITESLMSDIIGNIEEVLSGASSYTEITGSGTYSVPAGVNRVEVVLVGGGGAGSAGAGGQNGHGGCSGQIATYSVAVTPSGSVSYSCGAGGAGGAGAGAQGGTTTFGSVSVSGGQGGVQGTSPSFTGYPSDNFFLWGGNQGVSGYTFPSVVHGVAGAGAGGGGGAPCGLPFHIDTSNLGNGGAGGSGSVGGNATTYGAGGGAGATNYNGGNGSAGIIFLKVVG